MTDPSNQDQHEPQVIYVKQAGNGLAIAALCVGIAAVTIGGAMYILFPIALGLGGIAIVLGALGRHKARDPQAGRKTMATWGIVLGVVAVAIGVAGAVVVDQAVQDVEESVKQFDSDMREADEQFQRDMEAAESEAAAMERQWELEEQELEREADEQYQRDMEAANRENAAIEREIQAEEAALKEEEAALERQWEREDQELEREAKLEQQQFEEDMACFEAGTC